MIAPHHQMEWKKLPREAGVLAALRAQLAPPGLYSIPGMRPWSSFQKQCSDALVYGCLMGGAFDWRWK